MLLGLFALSFFLQTAASSPGGGGLPSDGLLAKATTMFSAGHAAEAQQIYEKILGQQPSNAEAQEGEVLVSENLALTARARHDRNGALGELLRAQKFAPDNGRLLYDLGVLEDELGLYQDADATVTHLDELAPGDSKAAYLLARVKLDRGQLPQAEAAMREYLKAHPEDATAHYGLGRIFQMREEDDQARKEFQRSLDLQPNQTESYYQLADMALKNGQLAEAIADAAKVLARDPHHGGALTDSGTAYYRQKQYAEAETMLRKAIAAAPDYQPAHYYLGLTLARMNRKEDSDRELALAAKMADEQNSKSAERLHLDH